jgi:hypothetical protein
VKTPSQELTRVADELHRLAERLRSAEDGERLYTRDEVDAMIERRLIRERKKQARPRS